MARTSAAMTIGLICCAALGLVACGFEDIAPVEEETVTRTVRVPQPASSEPNAAPAANVDGGAGSPCGESPEEILDLQYRYVNAGDYEAAYALFAEQSKALIPPDQYRAFFEENAPYSVTDYSFPSVDVRGETATVGVSFTLNDDEGSDSAAVTQELVCEGGAWRVVMRDEQVAALAEAGQETAQYEPGSQFEPERVVDRADVDGDGRLDDIALVGEPDEYPGTRTQVTVRVLLADGTTLTYDAAVESWFGDTAWWGATDFGQVPGEELVIGGTTGAHTRSFRVLTYRNGGLVELPYPGSSSYGDEFYETLWPIDAAASVYAGVVCQTSDSTVVLRSVSSVGAPSENAAFEGEATSWVLDGDQWRMTGSSKLEYPDASSAFEIAGWQCGDLPRGYD